MNETFREDTARSYDEVAVEYAQQFNHELSFKAFDRKMLELLVEKAGGSGTICDMGCGPGQIAGYLHQIGAEVCGIDLSLKMVAEAQRLHPAIPFQQGDMLALENVDDGAFSGIAAFYTIIHIPRPYVVDALRELRRVLQSDGRLLLTFHAGDEIRHLDTWYDKPVNLDFAFFEVPEMKGYLEAAGFVCEEVIERAPYPEEVETRRAYLFARKP